jgi:hypothetical protein
MKVAATVVELVVLKENQGNYCTFSKEKLAGSLAIFIAISVSFLRDPELKTKSKQDKGRYVVYR